MRRAVRNLIRVLAVGLVVFGAMEIGREVMRYRMQKTPFNVWHGVMGSTLIIGGIVLGATSTRLAEHFTDDADE
jgi:hypothetical protein